MILTYNFPGASSFQYFHYKRGDYKKARDWWNAVHERNGPCAPGGSAILTDAEAKKERYRDGTCPYNLRKEEE